MNTDFLAYVSRASEQTLSLCYHCHTCTAGCPFSVDMLYGPDRLIRLIELGEKERVLASPDIWLCATCETCTARCPNAVDVAYVMDTLRHMSFEQGFAGVEGRGIRLFHRIYLSAILYLGRAYEIGILGVYKALRLDFFTDLDAAVHLLRRGKLKLLPSRIKGAGQIRQIAQLIEQRTRG